jgi:hypothetical protein
MSFKTDWPLKRARVVQWELADQIAIWAVRSLPGLAYCWIERTGEHMVSKQPRRVEASLLAANVGHDGFLTECTFREPPDPLDAGRRSQQHLRCCIGVRQGSHALPGRAH